MADQKPKRRWFRFSLRTLFLLVLVLSVWLGLKVEAARKQHLAIVAVKALGVQVQYDFDKKDRDRHPNEPEWLINLFSIDFFHDVVEVVFSVNTGSPNGSDLSKLHPELVYFPQLRSIVLSGIACSDDDLQYLAGMKELQWLWLRSSTFTGIGLKYLGGCKKLDWLMFDDCPISDAGIEQIKNFTAIQTLYLQNSHVTDASIDLIASLPNLRQVAHKGL